mgnify:CR=1 FL=1
MSELIILVFDSEEGALGARDTLLAIRERQLLQLADAAVVIRGQDGKVKVKQLNKLVGTSTFGGAFWGLLVGMLFAVPWLGLAVGAGAGVLHGVFSDYGIDDKFIKEVGESIEPGDSALFLLAHKVNLMAVIDQLKPYNPTVLQTTLSPEDEAKLRATFGAEAEPA